MADAPVVKRKLNNKKIYEKYKVLKEIDGGLTAAAAVKKYGIPKQTLSHWVQNRAKIYGSVEGNTISQKRQRVRQSPYEQIDKACYTWLVNARTSNVPVSAAILKSRALCFAKELNVDSFTASGGWLYRWKGRYNVSFKTISGKFCF